MGAQGRCELIKKVALKEPPAARSRLEPSHERKNEGGKDDGHHESLHVNHALFPPSPLDCLMAVKRAELMHTCSSEGAVRKNFREKRPQNGLHPPALHRA